MFAPVSVADATRRGGSLTEQDCRRGGGREKAVRRFWNGTEAEDYADTEDENGPPPPPSASPDLLTIYRNFDSNYLEH